MKAVDRGVMRGALVAALFTAGALITAPLAAAEGQWIVDPASRCGTTSSFSTPGESIRWYGACHDGKLHGKGTLIWYNGQIETERNAGVFQEGEFHGDMLTTFPDGRAVYGQYWTGVRHGYFLVMQQDGGALKATYEKGKLISRSQVSATGARDWRMRRRQRLVSARQPALIQQPAKPAATVTPAAAKQPVAQGTAPARQARPATPEAAPATRGFWSRINPLNWGVVGFFSDLFGGGTADDTSTVADARAPQNQVVAPARATPASTPALQPAANRPAAAPSRWRVYGKSYDMNALLNEPHPFAGGGVSPWAAPAQPRLIGYQPVPTAADPRAQGSWRGIQLASRTAPPAYAAPRILPAQAADTLFLRGYSLESVGDLGSAATVYQQVMQHYPATRAGNHARARLNQVRQMLAGLARPEVSPQPAGLQTAVAATPSAGPTGAGSGARIVATNSPFPKAAAASSIGGSRALSMFANSPWLQQNVCTRTGIYAGKTGWCGRVLRDDGKHLLVEVQNVRLFGFGTIGISRSTCTGGTLLTWFSRGTTIRVPKQCLAAAG